MDDAAPEPLTIPGWIWIVAILFVLGMIVVLLTKYERPDRDRFSAFRGEPPRRSRHRRRHRHRVEPEKE